MARSSGSDGSVNGSNGSVNGYDGLHMICAIAELESDRQPLSTRFDRKSKDTTLGIMQLSPKTVEWLYRELHYQSYDVEGNPELLFRPFVSIYFGAAYLNWLSNFEQQEKSEEFVVRAFKGGTKKATHKSTLPYWQRYLSIKESFPLRNFSEDGLSLDNASSATATSTPFVPSPQNAGDYTYWDSRASPEDMEEMWNHPEVLKEWSKSGEKRGRVRFSHDEKKRPYLSRIEVKAVAEIVLSKHFNTKGLKPSVLCALAEVISMRFVYGVGPHAGIMGLDYSTAFWLYMELGFKAYKVDSIDDLTKPFVSMYFGAAYFLWLSEYEGRERTPQFVVQAYMAGPKNVNFQETGPMWLKFEEALSHYEDIKKDQGSCYIM
ncbi:Transglycosylase SLT domain [Parasponia andersonii]|uniref:Transglycosylase SLT domain n=1 Tax=Parasponia andersonii TaxID=3476 RepID=A0A2P5BL74_PARAD|nr:Transglycosylase SLT domain [Parasponia andersonii]